MTFQFILELESTSSSSIELDAGVPRHSKGLLVGRERMVCDWVVEEMVDLRRRHDEGLGMIGGALYYQYW